MRCAKCGCAFQRPASNLAAWCPQCGFRHAPALPVDSTEPISQDTSDESLATVQVIEPLGSGLVEPKSYSVVFVYECPSEDCRAEHTVSLQETAFPGRIRCYCGARLTLKPVESVQVIPTFSDRQFGATTTIANERIPDENRREYIPERVRHAVWRRDQGKCVECGTSEKLEFDHVIPFSKGGSNTERNLQLLCERCNRQKNARI